MNSGVFRITMENIEKHTDIRLVTTEKKISCLALKPNYRIANWFSENLLQIEINKRKLKMCKPICLGLPLLEIINV